MRNFKVFTVAALMAGAAITFTSCGGGSTTTEETKEEIKLDNGQGHVKFLVNAFESGDLKIDKSTAKEITKYFDFEDDDDEYLNDDVKFDGYRLSRGYTMYDGVINSISYNTYYEDENEKDAKNDSKELLASLKETLGKSDNSGDTYFRWEKKNYEITFNIFDDGYSFYLRSYIEKEYPEYEDDIDYSSDEDCAPDFYALRDDLVMKLTDNIKKGSIKIGKTTKSEMASLTGSSDNFNFDYKGMYVTGSILYSGDVLSSISLNYFYTCESAMNLLYLDKSELGTDINSSLGVDGVKDGDDATGTVTWKIGKQTLKQNNFSDGYSFYFN
jgi:hypothetical protein